jgi:hypothetical protein
MRHLLLQLLLPLLLLQLPLRLLPSIPPQSEHIQQLCSLAMMRCAVVECSAVFQSVPYQQQQQQTMLACAQEAAVRQSAHASVLCLFTQHAGARGNTLVLFLIECWRAQHTLGTHVECACVRAAQRELFLLLATATGSSGEQHTTFI